MRIREAVITRWDNLTAEGVDGSQPLHQIYQRTVGSFASYRLSRAKFRAMLSAPSAAVFIATLSSSVVGFALTYTIRAGAYSDRSAQHLHGGLALLLVSPEHSEQGIGSELHDAAVGYLEKTVRASLQSSSPVPEEGLIWLGSWFPRFFPGLPEGSEFNHAEDWLATRGWAFRDEPYPSIDLYRPLHDGEDLQREMTDLMELGRSNGYTFGPLRLGAEAELEQLEKRNFYKTTGWPDLFTDMIAANSAENIHCAYNSQGQLIGATIAAIHNRHQKSNPAHRALAFPDEIGTSCGIIACVGIDSGVRGGGAGTGMLASAVLDMVRRGADGCLSIGRG